MIPVKVLTGTTNAEQMYVLSMTFDDGSSASTENKQMQEEIGHQVSKSIELLEKNENLEVEIPKLQEPQQSSNTKV